MQGLHLRASAECFNEYHARGVHASPRHQWLGASEAPRLAHRLTAFDPLEAGRAAWSAH
jgi:hypothetical protein